MPNVARSRVNPSIKKLITGPNMKMGRMNSGISGFNFILNNAEEDSLIYLYLLQRMNKGIVYRLQRV